MSDTDRTPFEGWAILELMGHRRLAGYVRETELAGTGMLRLDVPTHAVAVCTCGSTDPDSISHVDHQHDCMLFQDENAAPPDAQATQFYSPSSVYCLTPTTETVARALAAKSRPAPVQRWELPPAPPVATVPPWDEEQEPPDEHSGAEWAELQEEGSPTRD